MKIFEAFNLYVDEKLFMRGASLSTAYHYTHCRDEAIFFFGNVPISNITMAQIRDWEHWLLKSRGNNTVREYITCLRCVLRYAHAHGAECMPADTIPIAKRRTTGVASVNPEEVAHIIDSSPSVRTRFVVAFLFASGVRVSEFCALNRGQIKGRQFTVIGKGNKERLCFIDARADHLMTEYLATRDDDCEALLVCQKHSVERVTPSTVQMIVRNAVKRAGIKKHITPHTFRHGFATNLIANGAPVPAVSRMLGHANLSTTMIYCHLADPQLKEVYDKFQKNKLKNY